MRSILSPEPVVKRALRAGTLVRVRRGVYIPATDWSLRDSDARYRALVWGAAAVQTSWPIISHESAAALWGLPIVGRWPSDVHVLVDRASGGRSDPGMRRHALGFSAADVSSIAGTPVTTLARTLVDIAASSGLHSAVATVDAALLTPRRGSARISRDELLAQYESMLPFRGSRRALEILEFAEDGAGSVAESASRVTVALAGFPRPQLQRRYVIDGFEYFVDLYWEEADCIGECDGYGKYSDPRMLGGRTPAQAVMDEKRREDALRTQAAKFVRWEARDSLNQAALSLKLAGAGLRQGRARPSLPSSRGS